MRLLPVCLALAGSPFALVIVPPSAPAVEKGTLSAPALEVLWAELAGADAAKAYDAVRLMVRAPTQAVPLLKAKLRPVTPAEPAHIARLIEDLRSQRFTVRGRANAELEKLAEQAEPALRKVQTADAPLEMRRRVEQLLQKLQGPIVLPELLRSWRAVEVLEHIGTPEAREVLRVLASGAPTALLTREARASLGRLERRVPATARAVPRAATDLYGDPLPAGARARLGTVRFRQPGGSAHVLFAPDGKTVLSPGRDTLLCVWDAADGQLLRSLDAGHPPFRAAALSPDGKLLAGGGALRSQVGGRGAVRFWDTATLKERRTILLPSEPAALAFLPDGRTLVGGDRAGKVWLWDVSSGRQLRAFQAGKLELHGLAVSPDGSLVATAEERAPGLRLWDVKTGREVRTLQGRRGASAVAFAPDGKTLVSGGDDLVGPGLWDAVTGRRVRSLARADEAAATRAVAFSPDGKLVASTVDGPGRGIRLWEAGSGKLLGRVPVSDSAFAVAFAPDSRVVGVATWSGVRLWRVDTLEEVSARAAGHRGPIHRLHFTPDGKRVVTASADRTVRIWDAAGGKPLHVLRHESWVRELAVSPNGRLIASSAFDDTVRLWETATGREVYRLAGHGRNGGRCALAFSGDGKELLSWGDDMYLRTWDVARGKALREHRVRPTGFPLPGEGEGPNAMEALQNRGGGLHDGALAADARALFVYVGKWLHVFDVRTGKERRVVPAVGGGSVAVAPAGDVLLLTSWSQPGSLLLRRIPSGEHRQTITLPEGNGHYAAFTADGKMFAVGSWRPDKRIDLWETATGRRRRTIAGLPAPPDALGFSPDGRYLAAGLQDTTVLIWDLLAEAKAGRR